MTWLLILALAGGAFLIAARLLHLPRDCWTLFAAALVFGLAGYAAQGSPDLPAAPAKATPDAQATGELIVTARREFFDADRLPARHVITADAFARRGQWQDAASFLNNALRDNPRDGEAWLALAIALVERAEGRVTPAALMAFDRAQQSAPGSLAPAYFYGLALLRGGEIGDARALWAGTLEKAPADARGRAILADRLTRLDAIIAQLGQAQTAQNAAN